MAWLRHNYIMSHVTKVCFIQLLHQKRCNEFEDRPNFFVKNLHECKKNFAQKTGKRIFYQELEKKNIGQISAQVKC